MVVLPDPLGPSRPEHFPLADVHREVRQGGDPAVVFRQVLGGDHAARPSRASFIDVGYPARSGNGFNQLPAWAFSAFLGASELASWPYNVSQSLPSSLPAAAVASETFDPDASSGTLFTKNAKTSG